MTREEFVQRYGGIYEHSVWVAEQSFEQAGESDDIIELAEVFSSCVDNAPKELRDVVA